MVPDFFCPDAFAFHVFFRNKMHNLSAKVQALAMQCSKSAVESNWKNQSQEERRSGKRKSLQWEAPKKIPAEEMGITNRQLLSAFIRHPNEARPGSHPITT